MPPGKKKKKKKVPLWCVIPGILLEFRKTEKTNNTTGGSQAAPRVPHIAGTGLVVGVVNSAFSLWAKFHSVFPFSKSRSQNWKKVWFSLGRRNDSCSPWRCDVHRGEGEGWRLAWPWTSITRVCLSLSHPQHFPLPCQAGIAGCHSTRGCSCPSSGDKHHSGFGAKNAHRMWGCGQGCKPTSPLLILAQGGGLPWGSPQQELWNPRGHQHPHTPWDNELGFYHVISF